MPVKNEILHQVPSSQFLLTVHVHKN